jgi:hypothetical protein
MCAVNRRLFFCLCLIAFLPLTAYAQDKDKKKAPQESEVWGVIKDLLTTGWLWAGLIVIGGLLWYLHYQRKHANDD